jgi:hypothetical protein
MGLRDLKKGVKDGWDGSVADLRKGVDSVKDQSKELARRSTKEGRAEAALERRRSNEAHAQGCEAAIERAIEAAERGDIRAEEAAITEAFKFNGGPELVTELTTQGRLRRGGYIGAVSRRARSSTSEGGSRRRRTRAPTDDGEPLEQCLLDRDVAKRLVSGASEVFTVTRPREATP